MESDNLLPPLTPELNVRDLTKSLDFYVRLLGFSVQFERVDQGFAAIALGGAALMLEQIDTFDEVSDREFVEGRKWITGKLEHPFGRGLNLQIHVTDLDAVYDRPLINNYPIRFPLEERC
jgi:catechol 2,3-dioxygenase-like lactoylglutathione lyase family enzyme